LPSQDLAMALSEKQATRVLSPLVTTALDYIEPDPTSAIDEIVGGLDSDLLCYWADTPAPLVALQEAHWHPILEWGQVYLGLDLDTVMGATHRPQASQMLKSAATLLTSYSSLSLAGLRAMAGLTGSGLLALACYHGQVGGEALFQAAFLEELYQQKTWGQDEEAQALLDSRHQDMIEIERFFECLNSPSD
ncbi:MAG: ATP12 family protein, partial [Parvularculales bacterium]